MTTLTGPIATFGSITGGSGYANGFYESVPLTGGNGSGALANITVASGAVTAVVFSNPTPAAQLDRTGKNYQVGDTLHVDPNFDAVGSGSGFSIPVATLANACENCLFGKVVPQSSPTLFGKRYCSNDAYGNTINFGSSNSPSWANTITQDDYFCGDGGNVNTGVSFSADINQLPATTVIGVAGVPWAGPLNASFLLPQHGSGFSATANFYWTQIGLIVYFQFILSSMIVGTASGTLDCGLANTMPNVSNNNYIVASGVEATTGKAITVLGGVGGNSFLIQFYDNATSVYNATYNFIIQGTYQAI